MTDEEKKKAAEEAEAKKKADEAKGNKESFFDFTLFNIAGGLLDKGNKWCDEHGDIGVVVKVGSGLVIAKGITKTCGLVGKLINKVKGK